MNTWMDKYTSRGKQPVETKNYHSPLETEENPTENGNITTDSLNKKVTAKENELNLHS